MNYSTMGCAIINTIAYDDDDDDEDDGENEGEMNEHTTNAEAIKNMFT